MLKKLKSFFQKQPIGIPKNWQPPKEGDPNFMDYALGSNEDPKDNRDYLLASIQPPRVGASELPEEFKIKQEFRCKNQGRRGSCTAQAQSHAKEEQEGIALSARFPFALGKKQENSSGYGAYCRTMEIINQKYGICEEKLYPEPGNEVSYKEYLDVKHIPEECYKNAEKYKSKSFWKLGLTVQAIKSALYENKMAVRFAMRWYTDWNRVPDGVLKLTSYKNYVGGHRMVFVGWTKDALIIKNSWGVGWGDRGYGYLPFDQLTANGGKIFLTNAYISLDIPKDMAVDKRYGETRTWNSYLREKSMGLNPWLLGKLGRLPSHREIKGLAYGFYPYEAVFKGSLGDWWLKITYPEYLKRKKEGKIR